MSLWSDADAVLSSRRQLVLPLELPAGKTFETFVPAGNELVVKHLERLCAAAADSRQVYLWGSRSAGKSHLLQAACRAVTLRGGRSAWLPLAELLPGGPGVLSGLESLDLVSIDGLDALARHREWQRVLFGLINEARVNGCRLLMSGRQNPAGIEFHFKDLSSRLVWGAVYRLASLDDAGKTEVLRRTGERLGCPLSEDALAYLLGNYPRDLAGLVDAVESLAGAAKERKRRVTVPFMKEVLPPTGP